MRRADRLFEIIQLLRGGRLRTSRDLAERLGVSTRTIWRDVVDLQSQGVPIDGERGVGYVLRTGYFLPPLALTPEEMEALSWGTQLVEAFGDERLARAAQELRVKIASVSSDDRTDRPPSLAAFPSSEARTSKGFIGTIREAIRDKHKLRISYRDGGRNRSDRTVRPLGLELWGRVWTLSAWCELRSNFRVFRCDRMSKCEQLDERFRDEPGKRLSDFLASMEGKQPISPSADTRRLPLTSSTLPCQ